MPQAKQEALKALAANDALAEAHSALALVLHWYEWRWADADRSYRRALELSPGDTFARCIYAHLLGMLGRADESVAEARAAVERDPLEPYGHYTLALMLSIARRFDEAMTAARAGIELDASYQWLYVPLAWGLAGLGKHDRAAEAFGQAAGTAPSDPMPQSFRGWALGRAGQRQAALEILSDLEQRRTQEYVGAAPIAIVNLGLGEYDRTFNWLQSAVEEREGLLGWLKEWFIFDPLRSDARFQALLKKMNFPQAETESHDA